MESLTRRFPTTRQMIESTLHNYFQPLVDFIHYLESIDRRSSGKSARQTKEKTLRHSIEVVTRATCLNQGRYLQYAFLAAERHRALKDELARTNPDPHAVANRSKALVEYMNSAFYRAAQENFLLLHSHFKERSKTLPRICIKGNFRLGNSDIVVTVFRDSPANYSSQSDVGQNSGFAHVQRTGKYFLDNDLFASAAADKYFNPRLDNDIAKLLARGGQTKKSDWIKCWKDAQNSSEAYRSTLIIPMTLWNNQIDNEFKSAVRISDLGRTIFGYLCIDHAEANYFDEETDTKVGYVFADLLSMYLFSRAINIEVSKSYEKAESFLEERGVSFESERLDQQAVLKMGKLIESISHRFKISDSTDNTLFSLDRDLLSYVGADTGILRQDETRFDQSPAQSSD